MRKLKTFIDETARWVRKLNRSIDEKDSVSSSLRKYTDELFLDRGERYKLYI